MPAIKEWLRGYLCGPHKSLHYHLGKSRKQKTINLTLLQYGTILILLQYKVQYGMQQRFYFRIIYFCNVLLGSTVLASDKHQARLSVIVLTLDFNC